MGLSAAHDALVAALQDGLPLAPRPYRVIGARVGLDEAQVIDAVAALAREGAIKRLGVVVRHRELGYRANAMVVWDVADAQVDAAGEWLGAQRQVTLCYRRPRRAPSWPYNLFCMIHGRDRDEVRRRIQALREGPLLREVPYSVLFSTRCFKQCGARYRNGTGGGAAREVGGGA